jgi:hypothetical protein
MTTAAMPELRSHALVAARQFAPTRMWA